MNDEPPKDLATRAFQMRVLDEFAAMRRDFGSELSAIRADIAEIRSDVAEIRSQQIATARNLTALDERLTSLEQKVDDGLKETRPIWEGVQEQLQRIVERFENVLLEFYELRHEMKIYGRRIGQLERRSS
jgi:predicted  nucleic acid-binding Zn-ribbon protein